MSFPCSINKQITAAISAQDKNWTASILWHTCSFLTDPTRANCPVLPFATQKHLISFNCRNSTYRQCGINKYYKHFHVFAVVYVRIMVVFWIFTPYSVLLCFLTSRRKVKLPSLGWLNWLKLMLKLWRWKNMSCFLHNRKIFSAINSESA